LLSGCGVTALDLRQDLGDFGHTGNYSG
jgi:hypothetical protein